ncbi:hypothetical protein AK812_SmicGene10933 [Symbiodinium microadriaticum]|uniref:Reverse transcriptase domain-containing protein n=1 Tax=Symbiodinium microadriaticum TaxID=2951 RepID=A0A1Q9EEJ9_SYMMI|nr:hypothetical protein AK812_SmicGene10933 [Symbiodinium microadriaticum]
MSHFNSGGRCYAALFVDIQAAYYEASRDLIFRGDPSGTVPQASHLQHLAPLVQSLLASGALELLGVPSEEIALLHDCVAVSRWCLVGSPNIFLATRGSRPGDGLADVLFGALFSIALRHIKAVCRHEGWGHLSAGSHVGRDTEVLQLGWADDLAVLSDYDSADELRANFPRVATVVLSTLRHLRFRVNLGAGKTEATLAITGAGAVSVRGELLGGASTLPLPTGDELRLTPEYRYLGVVQTVRDNGRRDNELNAQRAQAAWAHARSMLTSPALPWALKRAWVAGRVLPAAYATLSTCLAVSGRATAPLQGFFERTARVLVGSWQYGHVLTRPALLGLLGLCAPEHAVLIARARLVTQLVAKAPPLVWELFDAAWNRGTEWCQLLADACRQVMAMLSPCTSPDSRVPTILAIRHFHRQELYAAAAVYDVYEWPQAPPAARQEGISQPSTAAPFASTLSFYTVVTHSQAVAADRDGLGIVSPLWQGLSQRNIAWRLPREWHTYWRLWAALQTGQAWDYQHKPAFSCLRRAIGIISNGPDKPPAGSEQGPPSALLDLVAATVTFRQGAQPLADVFRPLGHSAPAFAFLFMHALRTGSSAYV